MLDLFEEFRVNLVFRTHSLCKKLQTVPLPVQKWEKKPPSQQLSEPAQRSNSIDGTFEQQKKERIIKQHSYFEVLKELALYGKSTCICWYQCRFSYIVERRKHDPILDFLSFIAMLRTEYRLLWYSITKQTPQTTFQEMWRKGHWQQGEFLTDVI